SRYRAPPTLLPPPIRNACKPLLVVSCGARPALLHDGHTPVHAPFVQGVSTGGLMDRAPVIPDHDVAGLPLVAVLRIGLKHVGEELVDEGVTLLPFQADDAHDVDRIYVEGLPSRFRVHVHDWVDRRRQLTIGSI